LLHDARREARLTATGDIVLLEHQDADLWDEQQIEEGLVLVEQALRAPGRVSVYAVQAAIAALHARAPREGRTDWPQIAALYEVLVRLQPAPVVELNRAVAVGMAFGPAAALEIVDVLAADAALANYHWLPSVRGDLLAKLGRKDEARAEFERAAAMTRNARERELLLERARGGTG
jgi:predicted RNA polymerase sigma factor